MTFPAIPHLIQRCHGLLHCTANKQNRTPTSVDPSPKTAAERLSREASTRVELMAKLKKQPSVRKHAVMVLSSKYAAQKSFPSALATPAAHLVIFARAGFKPENLLNRSDAGKAARLTPEEIRERFCKERKARRKASQSET